jgi:hypothetical protein
MAMPMSAAGMALGLAASLELPERPGWATRLNPTRSASGGWRRSRSSVRCSTQNASPAANSLFGSMTSTGLLR